MAASGEECYCTLLMSDSYLPGAAVLAKSLRDAGTTRKLAVLITEDSLLSSTMTELRELYDYVIPVERISNPTLENLHRLDRMDLRFAFTKIALWQQVQFKKIVYIDADVVALRAPDELFDIQSHFAAAPDVGWPDIFNSGVMVLKPSASEYWSLHTLAASGTSFDGADQGLLNEYFGNRPWHRLSFTYNCTPNSGYQYEPAYRHFRSSINMVHFIGKQKPWTSGRQALTKSSGVYKELLGKWWSVYDRHYKVAHSSAMGAVVPEGRTVQQYVKGERSASGGTSIPQHTLPTIPPPPQASLLNPEEPLTDASEIAVSIGPLTNEETLHKFSPPPMEWDATRDKPPTSSRPEASAFPSTKYEMSQDRGLFKPPKYADPPKDMYYQVPETRPSTAEKPKPIFPWEAHAKKPSRVFADDEPQPPFYQETPVRFPPGTASCASPHSPRSDPWQIYARTNAWDEDPSIDKYVRAFASSQQRKGPVQVQHQQADLGEISSPTEKPTVGRRESLRLTDFPTAIERPSLPVTPAPIHRHTFWGGERPDDGDLPGAKGVPDQAEWDPAARLEQLRRSSFAAASDDLPQSPPKVVPLRSLPSTASAVTPIRSPTHVTPQLPAVVVTSPSTVSAVVSDEVDASMPRRPYPRRDRSQMEQFDEYSIA